MQFLTRNLAPVAAGVFRFFTMGLRPRPRCSPHGRSGGRGNKALRAGIRARLRPFSPRCEIFSRQTGQFAGFFAGFDALTRSSMYFERLRGPRSASIFAQVALGSVIVALVAVRPCGRPAPARRPPRVCLVIVQGSIHRGQRLGVRKENRAFRPPAPEAVLGAIRAFHKPFAAAAASGRRPPQRTDVLADLLAYFKCFHARNLGWGYSSVFSQTQPAE